MAQDPLPQPAAAPFPEIPGYRVESVLGRGATGTVYRGVQLAVDREVAIKVLHPELGAKAVKRLQREARTTARLAHPGIVSAIDMGQVGGVWWYAMELVDGPALSTLLREKGRLKEREALRLFIPLCEALEHAHEHGVVHRDIKPANILLDAGGRARLVDLGLAFTEDDPQLTRTGGTLGTPHYLSPEQARNPQAVDVRSDIWSLGATMFHALCGRPPFAGESVAEILSGVLYAHIPDPRDLAPDLSPGMALVLRKCLTRNADRRYTTPRDLLRDLEALRERRAVAVSARTLDPVAGAAERRRRHLWVAGAATMVISAGLLLWQRPWIGAPEPGSTPTTDPNAWAPLERILADSDAADRRAPARALLSLDALRAGLPAEYSNAYWIARAAVQKRFEQLIEAEQRKASQAFERALTQERDFVAAAALVSSEAAERIADGITANEDQRAAVVSRLNFGIMRKRAAADESAALDAYVARVNEHYDAVILPRARQEQALGAWQRAREALERDVAAVVAAANIAGHGLPADKLADELERVRLLKVDSELRAIDNAWRAKDAELERAILARARAIERDLRERKLSGDAAAALDAAFTAELASRSIDPQQMLTAVADRAHEALEAERTKLAALEAELLVIDANEELAAVEAQLAPAWKDRRYDEIAEAWEKRLEEPWLAPVRAEIALRLEEARILQDVLLRAAQGLAAPGLDRILVGTIQRSGRIELRSDPLRDGFRQLIGSRHESYTFRLPPTDPAARLLGAPGVEQLAGFASDPREEKSPADRLARALFRLREGDTEGASKVYDSGMLPVDDHLALIEDLKLRLSNARGELDARVQEREEKARSAYHLIRRGERTTRDAEDLTRDIMDLLTQYADTEVVREHEAELREMRDKLLAESKLSAAARLSAVYGPAVTFPANGRALLTYSFSSPEIPEWDSGDWQRQPGGWSAERAHSREELDSETPWPRLVLKEPIDLEAPMIVEIDFEQPPLPASPPKRFVASVAGWHVGFASGSEAGERGQVAAAAGGPDELRELLLQLDKRRGTPIAGLERGRRYTLRLELLQKRGKLRVALDGQPLDEWNAKRPEGRGGSTSIVLRSMEEVFLIGMRIEAGVRK